MTVYYSTVVLVDKRVKLFFFFFFFFFCRCAINSNVGNYDEVMTVVDGWVDTLPGSRADISAYTEVGRPTHL